MSAQEYYKQELDKRIEETTTAILTVQETLVRLQKLLIEYQCELTLLKSKNNANTN